MFEYWKLNLSRKEKATYEYVVDQYLLDKRKITVPYNIADDSVLKIYYSISLDHPEFFQLPSSCSVAQQISMLGKQNIYIIKNLYPVAEESSIIASIQAIQKDLSSKTQKNDSLGIVKETTKWFVDNVSYYINNEFNQNAAAALHFKRAQCSGFSRGFKLLMDYFNIPCIIVEGKLKESQDAKHAWNLVMLENSWYHIDVTNTVPYKSVEDSPCFLLSDSDIQKTHFWESNIPNCLKSFVLNEDEEIFYSTYEIGMFLKREYLKRETRVCFSADVFDEISLNQVRVLEFIKRWYAHNGKNISYTIQASGTKFKIDIEYL